MQFWQKWRFSAPQTHMWLIEVWFSASTFVLIIATFAKRQTICGLLRPKLRRQPTFEKVVNLNAQSLFN